jgi:hypothetical protein
MFNGEITKTDEASGTITLKREQTGTVGAVSSATEAYKLGDGQAARGAITPPPSLSP